MKNSTDHFVGIVNMQLQIIQPGFGFLFAFGLVGNLKLDSAKQCSFGVLDKTWP